MNDQIKIVDEHLNEALKLLRNLRNDQENGLDKRRISEAITLIETAGMFANGSMFPNEYDPTAIFINYDK